MVYRTKKRNKIIFYRRLKKFIFLALLPFVSFLIISVFILNLNFFKIKNYNFDVDSNVISKEKINNIVENIFSHKYFYLYSKNNFLFYPKHEIAKQILEYSYEINSVDLSLDNKLNDLNIKIIKRKPKFVQCSLDNKNCFFVDKDSFVFKKIVNNVKQIKKQYLVFYVNQTTLGQNLFTKDDFLNILNFVKQVEKTGVKVESIIYDDKDFIYKINLLGNTKLIISRNQDLNLVAQNFNEIVKDKNLEINQSKHIFKKRTYYINLSNKKFVFYCLNDECKKNY